MYKNKKYSNNSIYLIRQLWKRLNIKRKRQLFILLITILLSGFSEIISIGSFIPFLSVLTSSNNNKLEGFFIDVLNSISLKSNLSLLFLLTITFSLAAFLTILIRLLNIWYTERLVALIGHDFSFEAYKKTICQPYDVHLYRNSSELIKIISIQIDKTIAVINQSLRMITSIFILIFLFSFLIIADWQVAILSMLFFSLTYYFIVFSSRKKLVQNSQKINTNRSLQIKSIQEGLGSIKDLIINNKQFEYINYYKNIDLPLRKWLAQNRLISNSPRYLIEGISLIFISFISYLLFVQRNDSSEIIPVLGAIALGAQRMLPHLQQVFRSWASIKGNSADLRSVLKTIDQSFDKDILSYIKSPLNFSSEIEFKNVSYKYKGSRTLALNDINLKIFKGEMVGIIGTTGSGKTSFIDLLMGLIDPYSGEIKIDNKSLKGNTLLKKKWYASISHVAQDIYLLDNTIAQNIAFGIKRSEIDFEKLINAAKKAQIYEFVLSLPKGFETVIGERGINLSGGQRQRIAIAKSLYSESSLIIFDEATSALDNKTEEMIMESINTLDNKYTIIMVAHRLSSLKNCKKIFKFNKGVLEKIIENFDINKL